MIHKGMKFKSRKGNNFKITSIQNGICYFRSKRMGIGQIGHLTVEEMEKYLNDQKGKERREI